MENERIKAIHDAAVHLFLQQGYARSRSVILQEK